MSDEKKTQNVESTLKVKATASLDVEVKKELEIPDITVEQAQAFLEKLEDVEEE